MVFFGGGATGVSNNLLTLKVNLFLQYGGRGASQPLLLPLPLLQSASQRVRMPMPIPVTVTGTGTGTVTVTGNWSLVTGHWNCAVPSRARRQEKLFLPPQLVLVLVGLSRLGLTDGAKETKPPNTGLIIGNNTVSNK